MKEKITSKADIIPSVEELQSWHQLEVRNKAQEAHKRQRAYKEESKNSFFNAFRETQQEEKTSIHTPYKGNAYYKAYKEYAKDERAKKQQIIEELESSIEYEEFFLRWERRLSYESKGYTHYGSNPATRYRVDKIQSLKNQLEEILATSPEGWEFFHSRLFENDIATQQKNRLVDVPYVAQAKDKITSSLDLGIPVYIVGHLGSGKTQLATEAALDFTIRNRMQSQLEEKLTKWYKDNPKATKEDAKAQFVKYNRQLKEHYDNILNHGTGEEIESLYPLFISGSHNLTYEDMFVEKTLTLEHSFSHKSFAEYLDMIVVDFYEWMEEHRQQLDEMTQEEQLQLKIQIWKSFSDLLVAKNSAFGTVIHKTEKEILRAVQEGRPVIIDELNTIAMQNLIALNDILQRHAGNTAYVTGVGPVTIQPGFALIGTGNLSTNMVSYEGTNVLNPAFKSRFTTIEYNYLPQNLTGSLYEQTDPEANQLFRVILAHISDPKSGVELPAADRTLEELFRLAQLSRVTQNVFMGKAQEQPEEGQSLLGELELKESVLSIRNILHVLDNWNTGEEKDLSKALWDGFISSITDPDDQNYIISQAVRFGFFSENEGWSIKPKGLGEATTEYEEIRQHPYKYTRPEVQTKSTLDLVHLVFGAGTVYSILPEKLQKDFGIDIKQPPNMSVEEYEKLDKQLSHIEHSEQLLSKIKDLEVEK